MPGTLVRILAGKYEPVRVPVRSASATVPGCGSCSPASRRRSSPPFDIADAAT